MPRTMGYTTVKAPRLYAIACIILYAVCKTKAPKNIGHMKYSGHGTINKAKGNAINP